MATIFETIPCKRCGGSGHYSFNMMYGTRCFRCCGSGKEYTKRGKIAREFYDKSLTVTFDQLEVGMLIWITDVSNNGAFYPVLSKDILTEGREHPTTQVETERLTLRGFQTFRRKPRDTEELEQLQAAALAYQANLTKLGKPKGVKK